MGRKVWDRLIDPSADNEDKHTREVSFKKKLAKYKLRFRPGSKKLHECIRRTQDALKYERKPGSKEFIKEPELYVMANCRGLIKEFQNYVWKDWKGKGADEKKLSARPVDKSDHHLEALHRLLIEEFKWRENLSEKEKRKLGFGISHTPVDRYSPI